MQIERFRACLEGDFGRFTELASRADLSVDVPTCPGWTMADLVRHLGGVYLHKADCIRLGVEPPWPPEGLSSQPPAELLDRSYRALIAEFDAHRPGDHAASWYALDQSVGFWIRRMAQETVIHRVDAELATGEPVADIADDLAEDGIDEALVVFLQYATVGWPSAFEGVLSEAGGRRIGIVVPGRSWTVRLDPDQVRIDQEPPAATEATVEGTAPDLLLWLWARGGETVRVIGDADLIELFRRTMSVSTQ